MLSKIARASETLMLADAAVADPANPSAPTPDEVAQTLHRLFVEAATAAFADWTDYLDALKALDAGEDAEQPIGTANPSPQARAEDRAGQGVTSAEVNRRLRDLALAHFEKAQETCRATQQLGANVCGPQIASELVGVLEAAAGTGTCACTHMSGDLFDTYLRIITLQKDFLLANQMGQAEFSALQQSIAERDDEMRRPSAPPPAYEKPDPATSVGAQFKPSLAATRLFSLDETPDLGRLFRTFVDFAVDPAQLGAVLTRADTQDGDEAFLYLRLAETGPGSGNAATSSVWTLAKIRLRARDGGFDAEGFWPATREELVVAMAGTPPEQSRAYLGQKDGLILLGARNASGAPRFELISVDVQSAARDAQSRAERALGLAKRARDARDRTDWDPAEGPDRIEPSRLTSSGLSLVNFSCASDLSRQMGMARALETERCDSIALDADDLLTGRLPAYGILIEDDAKEWLPVTGRKITYDDPVVAALIAPLYCDAIEAALAQAAVDRSVPLVKDYGGQSANDGTPAPKRLVARVPEVEFQLTGDPAGVQTDLKSTVQPIDASHDLAIDRTYSLSQRDDGDPLLTPPARFGEAGQIGFAAVYLGGGTLRPEDLPRAFDTVAEAAIPPQPTGSPPVEGRRFLRCDPVGAPSVSIPHEEAADEERLYQRLGQPQFAYQRQTAKRVVRRSIITPGDTACDLKQRCTGAIDGTFQPPIRRVVLPPVLPLETAELHGVFDAERPHWFDVPDPLIASLYRIPPWRTDYHKLGHVHRPADGLPDLHYQAGWGGMPVLRYDTDAVADLKAVTSAEIDYGKSFFDEAVQWSRDYEAWERTASEREETPPLPTAAAGDSVFARRTRVDVGIGRTVPFYPDPMASELVLRLTPAIDGSGGRIALTSTVPMVETDHYPDCYPVVIDVVRLRYGEEAVIETLDGFQTVEGTRCRVVEIGVPPGRSFTLDMWHRPSVALLENWSELVDTAASLEEVRADSGNDDPQMQSCGLLGRPAPTAAALRTIAERLHAALGKWPLLEISRVTSIDISHASSRPIIAPDMIPATGDREIRVRRRVEDGAKAKLGKEVVHTPAPLPADWFFGQMPEQTAGSDRDAPVAESTGQTVDLGGFVRVDLPSTGSVEIFAEGTTIKGGPFDDPSRTRGPDHIHRGVFPKRLDPETARERLMRAEEIYGFEVDPHGRVRFPRGEALWAQFRNIPELADTVFSAEPVHLSLHALFTRTARAEAAASGNPGSDTRVNPLMADTRARDVTVSLRCNSRFFEDFRSRSAIRNGMFHPATPLPLEDTRQAGLRKVDICVPASERPPKPDPAAEAQAVIVNLPHIAMPAASGPAGLGDFGITGGRGSSGGLSSPGGLGSLGKTPPAASTSSSRIARVRLWFKRPWFASGENEMVGLVLWPQADRLVRRCGLMSRQELYLRPSVADGPRGTASSLENYMALETFEDRDLAAAEQIVSRWGSDGTEAFPDGIPERDKWRHWTIPSSVFADFTHDPAARTFKPRRRDARHVADVALPVPGERPPPPQRTPTVASSMSICWPTRRGSISTARNGMSTSRSIPARWCPPSCASASSVTSPARPATCSFRSPPRRSSSRSSPTAAPRSRSHPTPRLPTPTSSCAARWPAPPAPCPTPAHATTARRAARPLTRSTRSSRR
ncbi:hypothetical protein LA6_003949 [Marinibacterium anthonyi]|nr:hypothetical protein LA6_003949 [Marinibacterium anthonyi]